MTLLHTSEKVRSMAFKDWTEWREDGAFGSIIGWGNARLERAGHCKFSPALDLTAGLKSEDLKKLERQVE